MSDIDNEGFFEQAQKQGCVASTANDVTIDTQILATWSYKLADAMLEARNG